MLNEFRSTYITWDKATSRIYSPVTANASDENGRKLVVQIVNRGQVEDLTGATLHLYWETRDKANYGLDVFKAVDLKKGEFELSYTTGMLSNHGVLNANLVLIDTVGRVVSEQFKITVTEGIDDDAIQSENSFSSLTQALIEVGPRLNDLAAQLAQTEQQVSKKIGNGVLAEMGDLSQTVKEAMTGGSVAVVGEGAVTKVNLANDLKSEIEIPIKNGLNNPDFADNTGWIAGGGSMTVANNVVTINSNSTSFDPRVQQLATNVPYGNGHKIYVAGKIRPTSSNVKAFRVFATATGMTNVYNTIGNPILNEWDSVSTVITLGGGGSGNLGLWFTFNQTALANEKVGDLKEVFAINLTDVFGAGNEPSKEKIDNILSYYPNGWFKDQATLANTVKYTMEKVDKSELVPIKNQLKNTQRKVGNNSVVITFDGSWENVISSGAVDEIEAIGGRATFFPNTTVLNQAGHLTSAQLLDLYNRGHEIGVYGSNASSNVLTGMTNAEVDAMIRARQADVKAIIGENPRSMAYPQGSANLNTHKIATRYFDRVRLTNLRWMMPKHAFVAFTHPSVVDSNVNDVISAIEHASKHDKDLVLIFHTIQPSGGTTIENFKLILQAIVDNNMRCEALETVMSRYNLIDDPWYDYPLTTSYVNSGWVKNNESVSIEEGVSVWGDKALTISGTGRADSRTTLDPTYPNYILSVPYKLTGRTAGSLIISVRYADAMDTYLSSQAIVISADTYWTNGRIEMILPDGAVSATIRLESSGLNAGAKCYFGRIVLSPTYAGDFTAEPV